MPDFQLSVRVGVSEYYYKLFAYDLKKKGKKFDKNAAELKWLVDHNVYMGRIFLGIVNQKSDISWSQVEGARVIEFVLPKYYIRKYNISRITEEQIAFFFQHIERQFRSRLFAYVEGQLLMKKELTPFLKNKWFKFKENGIQIKIEDIMFQYCKRYGLEKGEVNLEALLKNYSRAIEDDGKA